MAGAPERGVAPNPAPPTVAKVRLRFAKRGRLRFASHRDVARAFERAVRRAGVPVAHSHGFSPHPRLSWVGAAPTGTASEAEYLEVGLTRPVPPETLVRALNAALPDGIDVLDAVDSPLGATALADLIDGTRWRIELPGVPGADLDAAVRTFLARDSVVVERVTKNGRKPVDVRGAVVHAEVTERSTDLQPGVDGADRHPAGPHCAILTTVVRQTTPAVRPDDVLAALQAVADLCPPVPPMAIRLAQGLLDDRGRLADPFGVSEHRIAVPPDIGGGRRS
jgi:radical SAM-linked protein